MSYDVFSSIFWKGGIYLAEWWNAMPGFEKFFWFFAIPFTAVFLLQLIMLFIGLGDDAGDMTGDADFLDGFGMPEGIDVPEGIDMPEGVDVPDDADDGIFPNVFKVLSIRNIITFFTIFGWAGITFCNIGAGKIITVIASIFLALAVTIVISMLFLTIIRLTESGNVNLQDAVGHIGEVYVPIPANESGIGKVHVTFNGVFREIDAVTPEESLPTGTKVLIIKLRDDDTFVVTKTDMKG
ncbi:MAG TPA: hypothetical protein DCE02_05915 [Ruminiclostridium sp.]|nr:hypothetical protein [Ruminiclostridium sp.]